MGQQRMGRKGERKDNASQLRPVLLLCTTTEEKKEQEWVLIWPQ